MTRRRAVRVPLRSGASPSAGAAGAATTTIKGREPPAGPSLARRLLGWLGLGRGGG
jgi:hypothetical protein